MANTFSRQPLQPPEARQHGGEHSGLLTLTFDLLTLKVVSESRVTWATSMPLLVFLRLSVLDLGPMYATDRRQTKALLNAPSVVLRQ